MRAAHMAVAIATLLGLQNKPVAHVCSQFHFYPKDGSKYMTDEQAIAAGEKNMRHRYESKRRAPPCYCAGGDDETLWST